jgi:hypothetical protein
MEFSMGSPCVCGGSNENCRYCSGRGEIDDGLADALEYVNYLTLDGEKYTITGGQVPIGAKPILVQNQ